MHLVNDIDLIPALRGPVGHFLPNLTDIVHAIIRSRVNLNYIGGNAVQYGPAGGALVAGTSILRILTVHRPRQDLRNRRLSCTSGAAEKISMSDPAGLYLTFLMLSQCGPAPGPLQRSSGGISGTGPYNS